MSEAEAATQVGKTPSQQDAFWSYVQGALLLGSRADALSPVPVILPPEGAPEPIHVELEEGPLLVELRTHASWRTHWGLWVGVASPGELDLRHQQLVLDRERRGGRFELEPGSYELHLRPSLHPLPSAPERPPPEGIATPLIDAAWERPTRQSSFDAWPADTPPELTRYTLPTRPEPEPYWELDLGREAYLDTLRLYLRAPIEGTLRVHAYTRLDDEGEPSFLDRAYLATCELRGTTLELRPRSRARFVRVVFVPTGPPAALEVVGVEALALPLTDATLWGSFQRAFSLWHARPLFSCRERLPSGELGGYERWVTYGEVWARVVRAAAGLRQLASERPLATGPEGRVYVGICAPNQPEWAISDLACLANAFVVVPLPTTETHERLVGMAERCRLALVFAGTEEVAAIEAVARDVDSIARVVVLPPLDRSPPPASPGLSFAALEALGEGLPFAPEPREEDALHTILFSSGSTGTPKGAMRSYAACNALLTAFGISLPAVHLSFQPMSHFSERVYHVALLIYGGQIGFATQGERLYEELALLEPTSIGAVPRVYNLLLERYERDLAALRAARPGADEAALEEEVLAGLRGVFGGRLQSVSVGSAPPSRTLVRFLHRCFDFCRVGEGYGTTECATITVDDVVRPDVDLRLVDVPELGYFTEDAPSRGEILVRTRHMISGYLGEPETTAASFDGDGFFRTGDLGERLPDGRVRVIGRRKNVVKLAQGEFVAPERIEGILSACPLVAQVFVHADSLRASVVALVVPNRETLARALEVSPGDNDALFGEAARAAVLAGLREVGRAAGLLPFEVPAALALEPERLSVERGLATSSNKVDRRAVAARYAELFAALYEGAGAASSVLDLVRAAAAEVLGEAPPADADLSGALGVDSLSGVELVTVLSQKLQREVPLHAWQGASSLEELADRIRSDAGVGTSGGGSLAREQVAADLARELELDPGVLAQLPCSPAKVVLVSGATGFLGAHLVEELARDPELEVRCLVRAPDDAAAEVRLEERLAALRIPLPPGRARALAGDLATPRLGWDEARWEAQAGEVDAIYHAGAYVNWVLIYGQLRAANVLGTDTLLELAGRGGPTAFHFVSTISTVPSDEDEAGFLTQEDALRSSGYGLSKWVAEARVRAAFARGLAGTIHRPAMITGHAERGVANRDDFVNRYLATCLQLGVGLGPGLDPSWRCDLTPVDFVARAIVALSCGDEARGTTSHLTNLAGSPSWTELSQALGVEPVPYAAFRSALLGAEVPLGPLLAWFPEAGFRMRMGPWPCSRTRAALGTRDVRPPPAYAELVRAYASFLGQGS